MSPSTKNVFSGYLFITKSVCMKLFFFWLISLSFYRCETNSMLLQNHLRKILQSGNTILLNVNKIVYLKDTLFVFLSCKFLVKEIYNHTKQIREIHFRANSSSFSNQLSKNRIIVSFTCNTISSFAK